MKTSDRNGLYDLDLSQIREVLKRNFLGSLAFVAHGAPYVLPITYFYEESEDRLISYSNEGHKVTSMRANPVVALGVYDLESPVKWQSVLVHGRFEELKQIDAKASLKRFAVGVQKLLADKGIREEAVIRDFSSKADDGQLPLVYRIRITEYIGKGRGPH